MHNIVLLSGGLDSTVCATIASKRGPTIAYIVDYGQKHSKEIVCAMEVADFLNIETRFETIRLQRKSALTGGREIEFDVPYGEIERNNPSTYVPFRNALLLSLAASLAEDVEADSIYIGCNSVDFSGYWDCTPKFVKVFNKVVQLRGIKIITPLMNKTKKQIVRIAKRLNAPLHLTWSCYVGGQSACGRCDSCKLRLKGFYEAGFQDPLKYQAIPAELKNYKELPKF